MKFRAVIRKDGTIVADAMEGDRPVASSTCKMKNSAVPHEEEAPRLVRLDEAVKPYQGVTVRMLRARIIEGQLPAVKMGRAYLVAPSDVATLLTPRLLAPPNTRRRRETEHERATRQLAEAGIVATAARR